MKLLQKRKRRRMDKEQQKSKEELVVIDINGLAEILAEYAYKQETKDIPEQDIYPVEIVEKEGRSYVENGVSSKFAHLMFDLIKEYRELIMQFVRHEK